MQAILKHLYGNDRSNKNVIPRILKNFNWLLRPRLYIEKILILLLSIMDFLIEKINFRLYSNR
jgi:hypothetical protein